MAGQLCSCRELQYPYVKLCTYYDNFFKTLSSRLRGRRLQSDEKPQGTHNATNPPFGSRDSCLIGLLKACSLHVYEVLYSFRPNTIMIFVCLAIFPDKMS